MHKDFYRRMKAHYEAISGMGDETGKTWDCLHVSTSPLGTSSRKLGNVSHSPGDANS